MQCSFISKPDYFETNLLQIPVSWTQNHIGISRCQPFFDVIFLHRSFRRLSLSCQPIWPWLYWHLIAWSAPKFIMNRARLTQTWIVNFITYYHQLYGTKRLAPVWLTPKNIEFLIIGVKRTFGSLTQPSTKWHNLKYLRQTDWRQDNQCKNDKSWLTYTNMISAKRHKGKGQNDKAIAKKRCA